MLTLRGMISMSRVRIDNYVMRRMEQLIVLLPVVRQAIGMAAALTQCIQELLIER